MTEPIHQGRRMASNVSIIVVLVGLLIALQAAVAGAHDSNDHPSDKIFKPGSWGYNWNGWRIYLSPAHHWVGKKYGCGDYVEDDNMESVAYYAAIFVSGNLVERGYKVRVGQGDPDDNTRRSNNWGTKKRRHIPLHSNARGSDKCGGVGDDGGTIGFYYPGSSKGQDLAKKLKNKVGALSPGTKYENVTTASFYELKYTEMPAAYLEAEFHDWWNGKNWLQDHGSWPWRIGYAVDLHLNYP